MVIGFSAPFLTRMIAGAGIVVLGFALTTLTAATYAQGTVPAATRPLAKTSAPALFQNGPLWVELTPGQRQVLKPLAATWNNLDSVRKNKWMAIANTYSAKSPPEQEKMQSRMAEWAALQPRERAQARLNFTETKKITPSDRAAEWEAYQNLTPEEKRALAAKAVAKPGGAAVTAVVSAREKLTPVPITRHTPHPASQNFVAKPAINPKTLLPPAPAAAPRVVVAPGPPVPPEEPPSATTEDLAPENSPVPVTNPY